MLLERNDANPQKSGILRQTPLCRASANGHEGVVKMLLEQNDVNLNHRNLLGLTPLLLASLSNHEGVIRMLSERSDDKAHKPPRWHRRLLWSPMLFFLLGGLRMLLDRQSPQTG